MLRNVLDSIIGIQGIDVSITDLSDSSTHNLKAVMSNYFRKPLIDENITGSDRQYVISTKDLSFVPRRGDTFIITPTDYYAIAEVREMVGLGTIIGYRLTLE